MNQHNPVVQLLLTGNEIMSGDTVDSNSSMIALRLAELGLAVHRKVTVGDAPSLLTAELRDLCRQSDVVIVNGGLGPTIDDLTAEILAAVANIPLQESAQARAHIESWCEARGAAVNAANLKQALLPAGATIVDNAIGSAVGFELEVEGCLVICTPGVPSELRLMLDDIVQTLRQRLGKSGQVDIIRLQTFGLGESTAQQIISDHYSDWPAQVDLGFRAGAPQMEIKLTVSDPAARDAQLACKNRLYELFGDHIIGEGDSNLAQQVVTLLTERGETLTTAESCTGGLIASMLTRIPGSSTAFHAGFVTYANNIKQSVLDVPGALLEQHGAVSEGVVIAMAKGAMQRAGADYAIAVSGVAGPDGGTEEKPVGTVWLAWGSRDNIQTRHLLWPVERTLFQTMIAAAGLDMIRRRLLGIEQDPSYFRSRQAK